MGKKEQLSWQAIAKEAQEYTDASLVKVQPPVSVNLDAAPTSAFETLRSSLSSQEIAITESSVQYLLQ